MSVTKTFRTVLPVAGVGAVVYLLWQACGAKRKHRLHGEDGPIRVKGGSVIVEAEEEWTDDDEEKEFRPKNRSNFWTVTITEDGVPRTPVNGRRVEIDMVGRLGGVMVTKTVVFKAKGTIRVNDKDALKKNAGGLVLSHKDPDAFMQEIRVEPGGHRFGPYTSAQSKRVIADLVPLH